MKPKSKPVRDAGSKRLHDACADSADDDVSSAHQRANVFRASGVSA